MASVTRLLDRIMALIPVPRTMSDEPPPVDPRIDPASLEGFGRLELTQFGPGQDHMGGAPTSTHYRIEAAQDAREAERRRVDDRG